MTGVVSHAKSNTIPDFTGTVTVFNSAGATQTALASAIVRPSDWNSAHMQLMTLGGNTAGASSVSGSNIGLEGGPNITLSVNGSTIVVSAPTPVAQSVQTQGMVSLQGSTGAIVFSNSNNVSFGGNASTITASASFAQSVQTQNSVLVQGSTGAISFSNSNGITFGFNASTITASHNGLTSQSGQAVSAGNGSSAFQTLSLVDTNGVSWSTAAGGLGATVRTDYASSSHSHGNPTLALTNLSGTTASNSAGLTLSLSAAAPGGGGGPAISAAGSSINAGTVVFSNSNGISFGMNGSTITATVNPGAAAGIAAIQGGTQTATSGTVVFANSNGITFGLSGSSQLTASHNGLTTQTVQTQSNVQGISAGTQVGRTGDVVFANSNGITFGMSGSSQVTASFSAPPAQTAQSVGIYASSQTFGQSSSSTIDARSLSIVGSGGVSVGMSAGSLLISGQTTVAQTVQPGIQTIAFANTTFTTGAVSFSNANGISFGSSGGQVTASHNGLTTARASTDGVGLNTAQSNVTWTVNSSGMSLDARGYAGTGTTFNGANLSASMTVNSNGVQLSMSAAAPGAGGGMGISAGTQSVSTGTMVFSNSNNVTFGMSGSSRITASFSESNQTVGVYGISNTTGASSSSTYDARSMSIVGYGIVSVGQSNGSIQISTPDPVVFTQLSVGMSTGGNTSGNTGLVTGQLVLAGGANLTLSGSTNGGSMTITLSAGSAAASPVNFSAGTTSGNLGSVVFSNSNGISFGLNGSTITASAAGVGGGGIALGNSQTTYTSGTVSLSGAGAITIGSSTGQALQLSVPQTSSLVGVAPMSISTNGSTISVLYNPVQQSFFRAVPDGVTGAMVNGNGTIRVYPMIREGGFSASRADILASVSVSSSSNSSHAGAITVHLGIYTLNGSTLSLASSASQSYQWTNTSNNSLASVASLRRLSVPLSVNYSDGKDLFMAVMSRSSTTNANWFTASNIGIYQGHTAQMAGLIGEATANSKQLLPGDGIYSASSSVLPSSMALSHLTGAGSNASATHYVPNVYFANMTA